MLDLTILMPCLNEEKTVGICVQKAKASLQASGLSGEILIADNGSTDQSKSIALAHGARVLEVDEKGYGSALRAGIRAAQGRYIIMADSDDSYDLSNITPFIEKLNAGYDLVMGNRFQGGIEKGAMPFLHRFLGNPVLTFLGRIFFQSPVKDFHCGIRAFKKAPIDTLSLESPGMEFATEMVIKATMLGLSITEVPTKLFKDGRGHASHLSTWRDGWRHLRYMLLHSPLFLFFYPGLLTFLGGLLIFLYVIYTKSIQRFSVHSLLYMGVFILLGAQLILLATISFHRQPKKPPLIGFLSKRSLESFLVCGSAVFLLGFGIAIFSYHLWGTLFQYGEADPVILMRFVIPASVFMLLGAQIASNGFLFEIIKMRAKGE